MALSITFLVNNRHRNPNLEIQWISDNISNHVSKESQEKDNPVSLISDFLTVEGHNMILYEVA
jgi:hypothetical protein